MKQAIIIFFLAAFFFEIVFYISGCSVFHYNSAPDCARVCRLGFMQQSEDSEGSCTCRKE